MRTFSYYVKRYWLPILFMVCSISLLSTLRLQQNLTTEVYVGCLITIITLFVSIMHYYQDNDKFFKDLFKEFNDRYDALNFKLEEVTGEEMLVAEQRQTVIDYLNLCAEEYMWVRKGRIPHSVWKSWRNGIIQQFNKPAITAIVKQEQKKWNSSYYGFFDDGEIRKVLS